MKRKTFLPALIFLIVTACAIPVDEPPPPTPLITDTPQQALTFPSTFTPIPTLTQTLVPTLLPGNVETQTPIPTQPFDFCTDIRGFELIEEIIQAVTHKDSVQFSSLVSPAYGVDVRYHRDGKIINYDVIHAKLVFETALEVDWGISPGSGAPTIGSFREIVFPSLQKVFTPASLVVCGQLQTGDATYFPEWPYSGMNFYSIYLPGTSEFGKKDWQTWGVGIHNVTGKPYLAALVHYVWEP